MTVYKPAEFFASYQPAAPAPEPFTLSGLVKPGADPSLISFTFASCKEWIDLPATLFESIEPLTTVACDDHQHPYAFLAFAAAKSPETAALISLLQAHAANARKQVKRHDVITKSPFQSCIDCLNDCQDKPTPIQRRKCIAACDC